MMNNRMYLFFSVAASVLLSEVILSCSADTVIASGMGMFLPEKEQHLIIPVLMVSSTLVVGLTSMKKRKTWLDVAINVLAPWLIVLYGYVFKYKSQFVLWMMAVVAVCIFCFAVEINRKMAYLPLRRRLRRLYYRSRRFLVFFSMITILPAGVYLGYQQQTEQARMLYFVEDFEAEKEYKMNVSELYIPDKEPWRTFSVAEKLEYMEYIAGICFQELGVQAVPFCMSDEMENRNLACFNYEENLIYVNRNFLKNDSLCSLENVIYVTAHECYHVAQCQIIKSLMILEEAEFDYRGMEYYEDAVRLAEALHSYREDRTSYETYKLNEMEVQATAYGKEKVAILTGKQNEM